MCKSMIGKDEGRPELHAEESTYAKMSGKSFSHLRHLTPSSSPSSSSSSFSSSSLLLLVTDGGAAGEADAAAGPTAASPNWMGLLGGSVSSSPLPMALVVS